MKIRMQMLAFLGTFFLVLFLAHWLLYVVMTSFFPGLTAAQKGLLILKLVLLASSFLIATWLVHWHEDLLTRLFYYLSGFWLGLLTNLLLLFLMAWLLAFLGGIFGFEVPREMFGIAILSIATAVSVWGSWNAFHPRVRDITVTIPNLSAEWQGKKVVHLTDVHLGSIYQDKWLQKVVDQVNAVNPEVVLITGDLFDGNDNNLDRIVKPLDNLKAPDGVYFVMGNHETYLGVSKTLSVLSRTKVHILDNAAATVRGLELVGISYPDRGIEKSTVLDHLARLKPEFAGKPNILLFHAPVYLKQFEEAGINLQLSGHTHKGQIYPFGLVTSYMYEGHDYGLYPKGNYTLYTSNGVGTWGPAMRIGNIPEIVAITLK